jgi:hypothetical protein
MAVSPNRPIDNAITTAVLVFCGKKSATVTTPDAYIQNKSGVEKSTSLAAIGYWLNAAAEITATKGPVAMITLLMLEFLAIPYTPMAKIKARTEAGRWLKL